ncbi:hypothetical protein D9M72_132860 [compost metagenome]
MPRIVGMNEHGWRVGEDHPKATLTDHDVELMRQMHEQEGVGYKRLAKMFDASVAQARNICLYRQRAQTACGWKTLPDVVE